ncbi:hypothetical protein UPYG_G00173110 [Umbra pygmaea]|uniref:Secreted protein n=1 Tax=Umbra pygmaea TaxID=75934 RepID=A0ABD0XEF3_UMBPY
MREKWAVAAKVLHAPWVCLTLMEPGIASTCQRIFQQSVRSEYPFTSSTGTVFRRVSDKKFLKLSICRKLLHWNFHNFSYLNFRYSRFGYTLFLDAPHDYWTRQL